MCWWRVLMNLTRDDSRTRVNTQLFTMRITLRCTPTQSVPWGSRCVPYIKLNSGIYLKASWEALNTTDRQTCLVHKQTGIAHHAQQQIWPLSYIWRVAQTGRKTKDASRTASVSERNNLSRHGSQDKLDYTSRFVRVIPILSPDIVAWLNRLRWSVWIWLWEDVHLNKGSSSRRTHAIFASSMSKSGKGTPFNWLRRHKIVHWFGCIYFFEP